MGCTTCAKIFLVIINIIFVIVGLALLVVGCLLRFGQLNFLSEQLMVLLGSGIDVSFNSLVGAAALALIISGTIIFTVGFLGMCGAMCSIKCMLVMYIVLLIIIILAEIIGVILLFTMRAQAEAFIQTFLKDTLTSSYQGSDSTDALSVSWNYLFMQFDCCGITSYMDTHEATQWNRTKVDPQTSSTVTLQTPLTCCKDDGTTPDWSVTSFDCAVTPTLETSNYQMPCYSQVKETILSLSGYFIGAGVVILVIELLLIGAGIGVYKSANHKIHPLDTRARKT